ncbi:hypothetical protein UY3_14644 [Chelonia mydas]|uniref:Uncharacterized protein n=1 Tax=Chelonia mydas TaxID=8469 RepID=M7AU67_CHEMY|nr:hypothetical protein UY3_14644 [Chelonia mydas]
MGHPDYHYTGPALPFLPPQTVKKPVTAELLPRTAGEREAATKLPLPQKLCCPFLTAAPSTCLERWCLELALSLQKPIAALTGRSSLLQANGTAGSCGNHVLWPVPFPAAPIGLERRTAASGSCDRPNLQMLLSHVPSSWFTFSTGEQSEFMEFLFLSLTSSLECQLRNYSSCGKWPTPLPAAPIGLECQTTASGSRNQRNLRMWQVNKLARPTRGFP